MSSGWSMAKAEAITIVLYDDLHAISSCDKRKFFAGTTDVAHYTCDRFQVHWVRYDVAIPDKWCWNCGRGRPHRSDFYQATPFPASLIILGIHMKISIERLRMAINQFRNKYPLYVLTGDIISKAHAPFRSDLDTPVHLSDNAEVGRQLRRGEQYLRIVQVEAKVRRVDSIGNKTHASRWRIKPLQLEDNA